MLSTYSALCEWLAQFPVGRQIVDTLSKLIGPESDKGYLAHSQTDPTEVSFIVFDAKLFIQGTIVLDQANPATSKFEIDVRHIKDLTAQGVKLSDYQNKIEGYLFDKTECTIKFKDGHSITLRPTDFPQTRNFTLVTTQLMKL